MCSEFFAIRKSIVSKVLHEFVATMNVVFKKLIVANQSRNGQCDGKL
jgi:hypothetical protein